jgi:hypothetical protein
MPRYFFNVYPHDRAQIDYEGEEFPDKHSAWREAMVITGQIIQKMNGRLLPGEGWRLEVADEFAKTIYVIYLTAEERS